MNIRRITLMLAGAAFARLAMATGWGLQLNVVPLFDLAPHVSLTYAPSTHWSYNVGGVIRPWARADEQSVNRYWFVDGQARYWFCQAYDGWFLGAQVNGGRYNIGGKELPFGIKSPTADRKCDGYAIGGGIVGGYTFVISQHFNIELEAGVGYEYLDYEKYRCPGTCARSMGRKSHHYFGVNDFSINLQYVF